MNFHKWTHSYNYHPDLQTEHFLHISFPQKYPSVPLLVTTSFHFDGLYCPQFYFNNEFTVPQYLGITHFYIIIPMQSGLNLSIKKFTAWLKEVQWSRFSNSQTMSIVFIVYIVSASRSSLWLGVPTLSWRTIPVWQHQSGQCRK